MDATMIYIAMVLTSCSLILGIASWEEHRDIEKENRKMTPAFRRNVYVRTPRHDDTVKLAVASVFFAIGAICLWSNV